MTQSRPLPTVSATLAVALVWLTGCSGGPTKPTAAAVTRAAENPWPKAIATLRKETDVAACRRVFNQLNSGLAVDTSADQPGRLSAEDAAALRAVVPLSDEDVTAISGPLYTPLDAHYLAQAFHLRDAVRGLVVDDDPAGTAAAVFAWVCRHVEPRPWVLGEAQRLPNGSVTEIRFSPCLPPAYVLRRGSGNSLERAYVFLAALQQAGLDGCLVGPPDARSMPAVTATNGPTVPPGPFWAVGVRVGKDVLLFDPDRGRPFPPTGGAGVGTLAGIQADPGRLKPWVDDEDRPWTVTPDQVKAAVPFLAVPLTTLAPRLGTLADKLPASVGVRLAIDPTALRDRFRAETGFAEAGFWNPGGAPFTYTRTFASFLPLGEGGRDEGRSTGLLYDRYQFSLLPPTLFVLPAELTAREQDRARYAELIARLRLSAAGSFGTAFVTTPTPRELIQRGQFHAATPVLVGRKQEFEAMLQRSRAGRGTGDVGKTWLEDAKKLYDELSRASLDRDTDPAAYADAREAVQKFWQARGADGLALIEASVGEAGVAEATYQIALAKTEEAGRARTDDKAAAARAEAEDWWERYLRLADGQEPSFPGRTAHARAVLADVRTVPATD